MLDFVGEKSYNERATTNAQQTNRPVLTRIPELLSITTTMAYSYTLLALTRSMDNG
jgi:hypothetical protein